MFVQSKPLVGALLAVSVALPGCSRKAAEVAPSYVSPARFEHLDCAQVRTEIVALSTRVRQISGDQDSEAEKDAVAVGVGLVLFWPALFFLMGEDRSGELAYLKGDYESLKQVATRKECEVAAEIAEAERLEAERVAKGRNRTYTAEEGPDGGNAPAADGTRTAKVEEARCEGGQGKRSGSEPYRPWNDLGC